VGEISSSDYFAIVPEYVLFSGVSPNAVRLFAVLNRYANKRGQAWPSRKTLAELMDVSVATVDRAKDELVELGALNVENRQGPNGDPTSNIYTLLMSSPMRKGTPTHEERGTPKGDAQRKANMKQSQQGKASTARACPKCLGKYRSGYDDDTEGLSHIWEDFGAVHTPGQGTRNIGRYVICPQCQGSGTI
jgi:DNA-binding transcriptional MocR family regulator